MPRPSCVGSATGSRHHGAVTAEDWEWTNQLKSIPGLLAPKNWTLTTSTSDITREASLDYSLLCTLICCSERKYLPAEVSPSFVQKSGDHNKSSLPSATFPLDPSPGSAGIYCSSGLNNTLQYTSWRVQSAFENKNYKVPHYHKKYYPNRNSERQISHSKGADFIKQTYFQLFFISQQGSQPLCRNLSIKIHIRET